MLQEAQTRIEEMERYFDRLQEAAAANPEGFRQDPSVKKIIHSLVRYYEDGQWLRDYELDEQGLLPPELKRGVLSQDGLYDLLDRMGEGHISR